MFGVETKQKMSQWIILNKLETTEIHLLIAHESHKDVFEITFNIYAI